MHVIILDQKSVDVACFCNFILVLCSASFNCLLYNICMCTYPASRRKISPSLSLSWLAFLLNLQLLLLLPFCTVCGQCSSYIIPLFSLFLQADYSIKVVLLVIVKQKASGTLKYEHSCVTSYFFWCNGEKEHNQIHCCFLSAWTAITAVCKGRSQSTQVEGGRCHSYLGCCLLLCAFVLRKLQCLNPLPSWGLPAGFMIWPALNHLLSVCRQIPPFCPLTSDKHKEEA